MRVLVTAGSTEIPIDRVRFISNGFKGKTGAKIARYFKSMGDEVTLLTSARRDEAAGEFFVKRSLRYRTFDELQGLMESEIRSGGYDAVIHSAAVSDYMVSQVLIKDGETLCPIDTTKKISSSYEKMYLELVPTKKLIDQIRMPWGFTGKLVKFKLQVGISDEELIAIARESLRVSRADFIVANCLEWSKERAYIIAADGSIDNVGRYDLPAALRGRLK